MTLKELRETVNGVELTPFIREDNFEVLNAFSGDLMSDALMILRKAPLDFCEKGVLITGNATMQGVRTAEMLDFPVILLTRGKRPTQQVIDQAFESNIVIISCKHVTFTSSGKLYEKGLRGLTDVDVDLH